MAKIFLPEVAIATLKVLISPLKVLATLFVALTTFSNFASAKSGFGKTPDSKKAQTTNLGTKKSPVGNSQFKNQFRYAIKRESCAPNDSIAWDFTISSEQLTCADTKLSYPIISIHWSAYSPKLPLAKPIKAVGKTGDMDLQSGFCSKVKNCISPESTEIEIKSLDSKTGSGRFIITLPGGEKIESQFEIESCNDSMIPCG